MEWFQSFVECLKEAGCELKTTYENLKLEYKDEAERIKGCIDVYKSGKAVVSGVTSELAGGLTTDSIAKLITSFDGNWDNFAKSFDALFNSNQAASHTNMLENFARDHFGDEVFNMGSVLKNKSSDVSGLYSSSKSLVSSLVADVHGVKDISSISKLASDFDRNWDSFAKSVNAVFGQASSSGQKNILETFAISNFGQKVFDTGSIIKNETPNILGAIGTFKEGVAAFGGSYRNPVEAAQRIKTGVDNIVVATEQMAKSLNNVVKLFKGRGTTDGIEGLKSLELLSALHDTKVVKTVNSIMRVGGGAAALVGNYSSISQAIETRNPAQIISAFESAYDDFKTLTKDNMKSGASTAASSIKSRDALSSSEESPTGGAADISETDAQPQEEAKDEDDDSNDDSYVCSGATMRCSFGTSQAKLTVYPDRTVFLTCEPMANISDHISLYNIARFGRCRTVVFPPTGSATTANHGRLTPMPCVPGTYNEWLNGKADVLVKGKDALLKTSYCKCCYGGIITITKDGQK